MNTAGKIREQNRKRARFCVFSFKTSRAIIVKETEEKKCPSCAKSINKT